MNQDHNKRLINEDHLLKLEAARRLLFEPGYEPGLPDDERAKGALNNFPAIMISDVYGERRKTLAGMGGTADEARQPLGGRSAAQLFDDIDAAIADVTLEGGISREAIDAFVGNPEFNDDDPATLKFYKCLNA